MYCVAFDKRLQIIASHQILYLIMRNFLGDAWHSFIYNWWSYLGLIFISRAPQYFSAEPKIYLLFIYRALYLLEESNNLYDFLACFFSQLHGRNIYSPPRNRYWRQTLNQNFIERKPFLKEMLQINLVYWGTDKSSIVHAKER